MYTPTIHHHKDEITTNTHYDRAHTTTTRRQWHTMLDTHIHHLHHYKEKIVTTLLHGRCTHTYTTMHMYTTTCKKNERNANTCKWKCWSAETEVRKRKYGSEKKSCLSLSSAFLIHDCALIVAKGSKSDCLQPMWEPGTEIYLLLQQALTQLFSVTC